MKRFDLALVVAVFTSLLLFVAPPARSQPLADRVPGDVLIYIGWAGSANLGPAGYEGSHLQALASSSDVQKLFTETLPKLAERLTAENPQAGEKLGAVSSIAAPLWKHPTAFYFCGLDFTADSHHPKPTFALICDAGDDAAGLAKDLQSAIDRAGKTPLEMKVQTTGTLVQLLVGPIDDDKNAAKRTMLPGKANFRDALSQVHDGKSAVAAVYLDFEGLLDLIDKAHAHGQRSEKEVAEWTKARDAIGLSGVKSAIWTGAFDGKDWSAKAFVAIPAPRTGLLTLMDAKPLSDDLLKLIPSTAVMCCAGHFDAAQVLAEIRTTAGKINPNAPKEIDQKLGQFQGMSGLDLQNDLLAPLGDEWAVYADPSVAGPFCFGATLVNRLKDPAKAEQSIGKFAQAITNLSGLALTGKGMMVQVHDVKSGDVTIHYFATPIVRPAWTVRDGVLYAGLYPQVVAAAIANAAAPGRKSILENDSFVAMRKRLSPGQNVTCIQYADLPRTAPNMYPAWLLISGYAGFADLFGAQTPDMLLPPLNELLAHLAPAGAVSWVDDKGWHASGVTPFPGAGLIASDPTMNLGTAAIMTGLVLPAANKSREAAKRTQCASNMKQIGLACLLYSNDNKGKFPPDLGTLLKTQDITASVFVCPSSGNSVPPDLRGANVDVQAAWVNDHSSYIYLGAGLTSSDSAQHIVLYEKQENHHQDGGMNLLFGDGHVEWQNAATAQREIAREIADAAARKLQQAKPN